jgi:hypothetical protein
VVGLLAALVGTSGCGVGQQDCPLLLCTPPVTAWLKLPAATPAGTEVVACHESACATATLSAVPSAGQATTLAFSSPSPTEYFSGRLELAADGSMQLVVSFGGLEGDRYTLLARDSAGAELASLDETAHYPARPSSACPSCQHVDLGGP